MRWDAQVQITRQEKSNEFLLPLLLFYSGPQWIGDAHPIGGQSTKSTKSNAILTWKPSQTHPEIMFNLGNPWPVKSNNINYNKCQSHLHLEISILLSLQLLWWKKALVAQYCPTHCDSIVCSPPDSSSHGTLQARILEWEAISFSRGSSQPRVLTWVSFIAGGFFAIWATREAPVTMVNDDKP